MPLTFLLKCPPSAIPKGWNRSAQGYEERATLGVLIVQSSTLQGLYQLLSNEYRCPNLWSRGTPGRARCNPFRALSGPFQGPFRALSGLMRVVVRLTQGSSFLATL